MLEVNPVAHLTGELVPEVLVFQHLGAACAVVFIYGNLLPDVLFGDAEVLLDAQLYGKAVGVPSGLAIHKVSLLRLVAAEDVLDGAGHHVVDARLAVSRRGAVVENIRRMTFRQLLSFLESLVFLPETTDFLVDLGHTKLLILLVSHYYYCFNDL